MKKLITLFVLSFCLTTSYAQTLYESITSDKLDETRQLKIQLPRNYDQNTERSYPVIVVLNAEYLFEPVAGAADYFSYWDDIPEVIVVGIIQGEKAADDLLYGEDGLPSKTGAKFYEFIAQEVVPYIDSNFRTQSFKTIVGHNESASYLNYFLLKENPLFQAYISLSPDFSPQMEALMIGNFNDPSKSQTTFYYLATAKNDTKRNKKRIEALHEELKTIEKDNLSYNYNMFEEGNHYSVVPKGIPNALENIFEVFRPITRKEYKEKIVTSEDPYQYLVDKYTTIETLFGINKQILPNDFKAVETALKKQEKWNLFEPLSKLAKKEYPKSVLEVYYLGLMYEHTGEPKKAVKMYKNSYGKEEIGSLTVDYIHSLAEEIEIDFGWK